MEAEFQPYGFPHLTVIFLTIVLPFVLAAMVWRTKSQSLEKTIIAVLSAVLILNYLVYLIFIRSRGIVDWQHMLPMQMCDWGMVVVIVAMWTGSQRWFEVAYFWGVGGTLQAVLTPNLSFGFPDWRFISFFTSHTTIIVGVVLVERAVVVFVVASGLVDRDADFDEAARIQKELEAVKDLVFNEPIVEAVARIKVVLQHEGLIRTAKVRRPQLGISEAERKQLLESYRALKKSEFRAKNPSQSSAVA